MNQKIVANGFVWRDGKPVFAVVAADDRFPFFYPMLDISEHRVKRESPFIKRVLGDESKENEMAIDKFKELIYDEFMHLKRPL